MKAGDALADGNVQLSDGTRHSLSEFWAKAPTVLVFLRHFG
jgi:hypothetical protein